MAEQPPPDESNDDVAAAGHVAGAQFAPAEPTDARTRGSWATRYPEPLAKKWIRLEAAYVGGVFFLSTASLLLMALDLPAEWGWISSSKWNSIKPFSLAFFGGATGGTLFATKWLYHSVAKEIWNIDRRLWRFFTPMLSSGAALTVVVLSAGGVIPLFGQQLVRTNAGALGVSLLIGYFSDRAFSMLERMAVQQFGLPKGQRSE